MTLIKKVAQARAEADAEFRPRIERALAVWPVDIFEINVAGLPCQVVAPSGAQPRLTMLYFFGGGYVTGGPANDLPITAALASLGSIKIIAPRYGLSPENSFPMAITRSTEVYRALAKDQALTVCGESAGGGLALAVIHQAIDAGLPLPHRVALLSPFCDLREETTTASEIIDDPLLSTDSIRFCTETYLNGSPANDPRASPLLGSFSTNWPATLLTTGSRDRLRHSVLALAEKITAVTNQCDLIDMPDMPHVFEAYDEYPEALETLKRIATFLGQ